MVLDMLDICICKRCMRMTIANQGMCVLWGGFGYIFVDEGVISGDGVG